MTTEPRTADHHLDQDDVLPTPGGWTTVGDLVSNHGYSAQEVTELLRQAARDGLVVDGAFLKGGGPGSWFRPSRATITDHAIVSGRTGSGKTTSLRAFWRAEDAAPDVESWVCDVSGSLDAATAADRTRYAAGLPDSITLLDGARDLISDRSRQGFRAGDGPVVIVSVDDAVPQLCDDPQAVHLLEGLALLGRPLGVVPRVTVSSNRISDLRSGLLWRYLNYPNS